MCTFIWRQYGLFEDTRIPTNWEDDIEIQLKYNWNIEHTLQGINISHLEKENHLQNAILGGYVSSLEGILSLTVFLPVGKPWCELTEAAARSQQHDAIQEQLAQERPVSQVLPGGVCLFVCLFVRFFVCLFGWLVGWLVVVVVAAAAGVVVVVVVVGGGGGLACVECINNINTVVIIWLFHINLTIDKWYPTYHILNIKFCWKLSPSTAFGLPGRLRKVHEQDIQSHLGTERKGREVHENLVETSFAEISCFGILPEVWVHPVWIECEIYIWYNYPTFWTCIKVKEHLNNEKARWEAKDGEDDSWSTDLLDAAQAAREKHLSHVQEMFGREKEARERFSVSSFSFGKNIDFMPGARLLMIDSTWYRRIAKDKLHEHHQDLLGRERAANEAKCLWDEYCILWPFLPTDLLSVCHLQPLPLLLFPEPASRCTWSHPKRTECKGAAFPSVSKTLGINRHILRLGCSITSA